MNYDDIVDAAYGYVIVDDGDCVDVGGVDGVDGVGSYIVGVYGT